VRGFRGGVGGVDGPVRYWDELASVFELWNPGWEAAEKGLSSASDCSRL
jgi:hypothetical protein